MANIDIKLKKLLKKQNDVQALANKANSKRSEAYVNIVEMLARTILKGSYLSQVVWTIPDHYVDMSTKNNFSLSMDAPLKDAKGEWATILKYMAEHCYRVQLTPYIILQYSDCSLNLGAQDNERLAAFIKKYGLLVVCPALDELVLDIESKLVFIKGLRSQLKTV